MHNKLIAMNLIKYDKLNRMCVEPVEPFHGVNHQQNQQTKRNVIAKQYQILHVHGKLPFVYDESGKEKKNATKKRVIILRGFEFSAYALKYSKIGH